MVPGPADLDAGAKEVSSITLIFFGVISSFFFYFLGLGRGHALACSRISLLAEQQRLSIAAAAEMISRETP